MHDAADVDLTCAYLRERRDKVRGIASLILWVMLFSILVSLVVFVRAGELSTGELNVLTHNLRSIERNLGYLPEYLQDVRDADKAPLDVAKHPSQVDEKPSAEEITEALDAHKKKINYALGEVETAVEKLKTQLPYAVEEIETEDMLAIVVQTSVTRAGVVLMTVFLVQMLSTIYRFNHSCPN